MQEGAIEPGQNVIVVDDLIATGSFDPFHPLANAELDTGGSAKAAGELVAKAGGKTLEYLFIIELMFLQAATKLDAPLYSIVQSED